MDFDLNWNQPADDAPTNSKVDPRHSHKNLFARLHFCFVRSDFGALFLYIKPNPTKNAHIHVGNADQRKARNQVPSPIRKQKFESGDDQEEGGDVVAEAVFAGKQIKEFPLIDIAARFAPGHAVIAELSNDLFVGDGPRNRRNRKRQDKQVGDLY